MLKTNYGDMARQREEIIMAHILENGSCLLSDIANNYDQILQYSVAVNDLMYMGYISQHIEPDKTLYTFTDGTKKQLLAEGINVT